MSTVNTIRGPIDSSDLGRTLSHEHLTNGWAGMERIPGFMDREEMIARSVEALEHARAAGIHSIIDATPWDLGRQPWLFEAVAERTDVHVVCSTGVYRWVPSIYFGWEIDELAEHWIREIEDGIEDTEVKAGIIKLAWDVEYRLTEGGRRSPRAMLEHTARAAARASEATGVPITCHTRAQDELGTPLLDLFEDEGLDLRAVTIGHSNDSENLDYLSGLAERGATVGLDRFHPPPPSEAGDEAGDADKAREAYIAQRSGIALGLIRAGYAERVSLGHDAFPAGLWGRWREERWSDCFTHVPLLEVPWLLENGASEDDIEALLDRSVRATFDAAASMRA